MKINFEQGIFNLDGTEMKTEKGEPFTLRNACVVSLDAATDEVRKMTGEDKFKRGQLAARIYRTKEPINLKAEEIAIIKTAIGFVYGPHIIHETWNLLDPPERSEDETKELPVATDKV